MVLQASKWTDGEVCKELLLYWIVWLQQNTWRKGIVVCKAWYRSDDTCVWCLAAMENIRGLWNSKELQFKLTMLDKKTLDWWKEMRGWRGKEFKGRNGPWSELPKISFPCNLSQNGNRSLNMLCSEFGAYYLTCTDCSVWKFTQAPYLGLPKIPKENEIAYLSLSKIWQIWGALRTVKTIESSSKRCASWVKCM